MPSRSQARGTTRPTRRPSEGSYESGVSPESSAVIRRRRINNLPGFSDADEIDEIDAFSTPGDLDDTPAEQPLSTSDYASEYAVSSADGYPVDGDHANGAAYADEASYDDGTYYDYETGHSDDADTHYADGASYDDGSYASDAAYTDDAGYDDGAYYADEAGHSDGVSYADSAAFGDDAGRPRKSSRNSRLYVRQRPARRTVEAIDDLAPDEATPSGDYAHDSQFVHGRTIASALPFSEGGYRRSRSGMSSLQKSLHYGQYLEIPKGSRSIFASRERARRRKSVLALLGVVILLALAMLLVWHLFSMASLGSS